MQLLSMFKRKTSSKLLLTSLALVLFSLSSLQLLGFKGVIATSAACTPNFTLTASAPQSVAAGLEGTVAFTATSECGLSGTVGYSVSVSPSIAYPNGISVGHLGKFHPLVLSSTKTSGTEVFAVSTTSSTIKTTYTVTFTVTADSVTHTAQSIVTVNGYTITVSPSSVSAPLNQPAKTTITLTSFGGYSATFQYSISISPDTASGSDSCFNPTPTEVTISSSSPTSTSQWSCAITPAGTYSVTILAMPFNGQAAPELSTSVTVTVS